MIQNIIDIFKKYILLIEPDRDVSPKNILILGGSYFIGKAVVDKLITIPGINLHIANRDTRGIIYPHSKKIKLDRNIASSCKQLKEYKFDLTIDFSCYSTKQLKNTLAYLRTKRYIFLSSSASGMKDTTNSWYEYGKQKWDCEQIVIKKFPNHLIIRPCYVLGEGDYLDRFRRDEKYNLYYMKNSDDILKTYIEVGVLANTIVNMVKFPITGLMRLGY